MSSLMVCGFMVRLQEWLKARMRKISSGATSTYHSEMQIADCTTKAHLETQPAELGRDSSDAFKI